MMRCWPLSSLIRTQELLESQACVQGFPHVVKVLYDRFKSRAADSSESSMSSRSEWILYAP